MRRLAEIPVGEDSSPPPSPDPCRTCGPTVWDPVTKEWNGPLREVAMAQELKDPLPAEVYEADDDELGLLRALKLIEDAHEAVLFTLTPEVKKAVPIPVWNALTRIEVRLTNFLDDYIEET